MSASVPVDSQQSADNSQASTSRPCTKAAQEADANLYSDCSMGDDFVTFKPARNSKRRKPVTPKYVVSSGSDSDGVFEEKQEANVKEYRCTECSYKSNMRYLVARHKKSHESTRNSLACPHCQWSSSNLKYLEAHIQKVHSRNIEIETLAFADDESFQKWLIELQENTFSKYRRRKTSDTGFTYTCNRSSQHQRKSRSSGKRFPKKQGPTASEHVCTSRIKVEKTKTGLEVIFHKTHTGHTLEPGKVGLTSPQKRKVAHELKAGVPSVVALKKLRSEQTSDINRAGIANMQDIRNITKKFHLNSGIRLDPNDAKSMDITKRKLEQEGDQGVFLYKACGVLDPDFQDMSESDFLFGYMNEAQQHMLETHGKDIICIDGTHGTNAYGFELSTLVVLDDQFQGFPVAFFYHTRKSQDVYDHFFRKLKERVGEINCRVFMSDDETALYNSWLIMGTVGKKLLCTWHVVRNWKKHLAGLDAVLRKEVYTKLKSLMKELDIPTFEDKLKVFLHYLTENPKLTTFSEYFRDYYLGRTLEWAYYYRIGAGINTNMHVERMHREIKYNFFHMKKITRMDISFAAIREFLRSKQDDRIISIFRGKVTTKDKMLRKFHVASLEMDVDKVMCMGKDHYLVQSTKPDVLHFYSIKPSDMACQCSIVCSYCKVCIHAYSCTCEEYSIRMNMCRHIHLVVRSLDSVSTSLGNVEDEGRGEDGELIMDIDDRMVAHASETRAHLLDFSRQSKRQNMDDIREKAIQNFNKALERANNLASMQALLESTNTLMASVECTRTDEDELHMPSISPRPNPTKNLEPQLRFLVKDKKKTRAKSTVKSSVDSVQERLSPPPKILPFTSDDSGALDAGKLDGDPKTPGQNSANADTPQG